MKLFVTLFALTLGLLLPAVGSAGVITFNDRELFEAQGAIAFNSNFNDFGTGLNVFGNGLTRGDVTYPVTIFTYGPDTPWTDTAETLLGDIDYGTIFANIAPGLQYDMFGFDIGVYGPGLVGIELSTNLGGYLYPGLTLARSDYGNLEFLGFVAKDGEFFTGVRIYRDTFPDPGPFPLTHPTAGITNVAVGHIVPEPASMLLLGTGLVGLAARRYRRRRA